jgi:hypothetical protein
MSVRDVHNPISGLLRISGEGTHGGHKHAQDGNKTGFGSTWDQGENTGKMVCNWVCARYINGC